MDACSGLRLIGKRDSINLQAGVCDIQNSVRQQQFEPATGHKYNGQLRSCGTGITVCHQARCAMPLLLSTTVQPLPACPRVLPGASLT